MNCLRKTYVLLTCIVTAIAFTLPITVFASHSDLKSVTIDNISPNGGWASGTTADWTLTVEEEINYAAWSSTRFSYRLTGSGNDWDGICQDHTDWSTQGVTSIQHTVSDVPLPNHPGLYDVKVEVFPRHEDECDEAVGGVANATSIEEIFVEGDEEARIDIHVTKFFINDDNPYDVVIKRDCDDGLLPDQETEIGDGEHHNFVITEHTPGNLSCTITEEVPTGYIALYHNETSGEVNNTGCYYPDMVFSEYECRILNSVNWVEVEVTKEWVDEHKSFNNSTHARARARCDGEIDTDETRMRFEDDGDTDSFWVKPHWNGETECSVYERVRDSSVISDTSGCEDISVVLQDNVPEVAEIECTIVNTRIYEGVPTLSQYGLALMALLMLGFGLVGFRRFA